MRRRAGIIVLLMLNGPAVAENRREEARQQVREGNRLLTTGDCQGALARFERARDIYPDSYKIELNLGSALECLGQLPRAAERFESFLRRSDADRDRGMQLRVQRRLGRLKKRLASVSLSCEVAGADVVINEGSVGSTPLDRRLYLNPGMYNLSVRKRGYPLFQWQGRLAGGEHRRVLVPWVPRPEPTGSPPPPVVAPVAPVPLAATPRPVALEARDSGGGGLWYRRWWVWTLVGAVVVGATTAVVATQTGGSDRLPGGEAGVITLE